MKKIAIIIVIAAIALVGWFVWGNQHNPKTSNSNNTQTNTFNKKQYSLTDPTSLWVVVNKHNPLNPLTYAPSDLTPVGNGQYMRAAAAQALQQMISDAQTAGYNLTPASGYRSYDTQVSVYNSEVHAFGQAYADTESARPGYSEHQTGWAIDLASDGCNISDCFGSTPGGKWATANAYKYGFLLRYPADQVNITGYRHETWHFRYIGTALATEMHKENSATLEQFFGLGAAPDYN
jgi:zinc D-Ala-D-Ala carboxypeptidase